MEQTKQPRDIRSLTMDELTELVASCKQPAFRAKQLAEWLFDKNVCSFDEMTNLPKSLRDQLAQRFREFRKSGRIHIAHTLIVAAVS